MSTRHLFLPFLIALAGFVSCDEIQPEELSVIDIDLPSIETMCIPLVERIEGDNYLSDNKSVSGVRLNHYKLSDDGLHLEIDLSITLYRETKGDIRVLYKGPTNVKVAASWYIFYNVGISLTASLPLIQVRYQSCLRFSDAKTA